MANSFNFNVYGAMLRVKAAYPFEIGGLLMRMYAFMRTIGTITMLTLSGYSYLMSGLVASVVAFSLFLISPRVSKLIDERGQSRVVPVSTCIALSGCAVILATVLLEGPIWVCFVGAVLMGFLPTPQALTRARWVYLVKTGRLGDAAPELKTVFSYEGVMDDLIFMISPALSIALASSIHPVAGMVCGFICCAVGMVLLVSSKSTEPSVGWEKEIVGAGKTCDAGKAMASGADGMDASSALGASARGPRRAKSLFFSNPVVRVLFFLSFLMGGFFGVLDTATVSFAQIELDDPTFASVVLVIESFVSTVAGIVFGMVIVNARQSKKMLVASVAIGLGYGSMALVSSWWVLLIVIFVAAGTYAPFIITMNETVEQAVSETNLTEALTWVTSGSICGLAFGPTLAGLIIDTWGSLVCFTCGGVLALIVPVLAIVTYPMMKRYVG